MNPELQELLAKPTATIRDVGRLCFNLSPGASYRAARTGLFPTIQVGGRERPRFLVPTSALRKLLGLETA
jgi:hypothetical protein